MLNKGKKRSCEYCKQEGHEVDSCQEKLASYCMGEKAQGEIGDDQMDECEG